MLYLDERVELPKTKTYANGPYIYYRLGSYMQNGKERHHQRCIGKCFTDAQNKRWLIPNEFYYEQFNLPLPAAGAVKRRGPAGAKAKTCTNQPDGTRMGIAFTLSVICTMVDLNIYSILESVFDDGRQHVHKAAAIAAYYLQCDGNNSLAGFRRFTEENFTFLMEPFDDRRVCEEFKLADLIKLENFERLWIAQALKPGELLYYDVTSLSTYSERIDGAARGYNRDHEALNQINIGLMCTAESRLPLFITLYDGPLNDAYNYNTVMSRLKALGLPDGFDIICDGGFSRDNLRFSIKHGHCIMMACSYNRYASVREAVLQHRSELEAGADNITMLKNAAVVSTRVPFSMDDVKGELLIYLDYEKQSLQTAAVVSRKEKLEAELQELTGGCPGSPEKYEPYFTVKPARGRKGFTYSVDEPRFLQELKLCGISTFFSTRKCRDNMQCLLDYRSKDVVEKMFMSYKNDILDGRPLVHSAESLQGKTFYMFIALILYKEYERRFAEVRRKHRTTMAECFKELQRIKLVKTAGRWVVNMALTPLQKELLKAARVPQMLSEVEGRWDKSAVNSTEQ